MVSEEFLKKLRSAFDLNIYEAKIWAALLSKGVATAGELSEISGVPRSRAYDVLESLEKSGFIIMKIGKPIKYLAVKPEDVFKRVKKQLQEKATEQVKMLENVESTNVLKDLQLLFTNGIVNIDPCNISGAIKGRKNLYNQMYDMIETAQKSVYIATTSNGVVRKIDHFAQLFKRLNDKNVKIRVMSPLNENTKKSLESVNKFIKSKSVNDLKARFIIVDGKQVMFMTNSDDAVPESSDVGIWIDSSFFASALENLFNSNWNKEE